MDKMETAPKRPTTLAYHHLIKEHFPGIEGFKKEATNVEFNSVQNLDDSAPDAVWAYTPESLAMYSGKDDTGKPRAAVSISQVSSSNKYSEGYNACTGIAGMGIDKETKEPISFLSHLDPTCLLGRSPVTPEEHKIIVEKLRERAATLVARCEPDSISFEIVGGGFTYSVNLSGMYTGSIVALGDIVESAWGKRPLVTFGTNMELEKRDDSMDETTRTLNPKHKRNTDVYVDTKHRGVTVVRPEQVNHRWNNGFIAPRNWEEWEKVNDSSVGKGDGILPLGHNSTPSLELWIQNPEKWKEIYGGSRKK